VGAEIPDGAVIVARAIINSSLWKMRPEDRVVAVTCLAIANKQPKRWFDGHKQVIIKRGQFVRSREEMALECGLPLQVVRTSLDHLEKTEFLTRFLTRTYTLYTVPKYQHYQDLTKYSDYGVRKPTRFLTRLQPGKTSKSNPEFAQASDCNPTDGQGVASLLTNCGDFLTRQNGKTNHKQQQQTTNPIPSSPIPSDAKTGEGDGRGAVVVVQRPPTDPLLDKVSFRISLELLSEIKMSAACSSSFAATKTVGQILRVVQQARLQKKPGGWARIALENDWLMPEASGIEFHEVVEKVKRDVERANSIFEKKLPGLGAGKELPDRRAGEDDGAYFRRVSDELKRRKEVGKSAGSEKRK
jgi:hypothetical protein